jgi:aryl-alcohol dehydrogenase-like predicted oxidoreductase
VTSVIFGSRNPQQFDENAAALDVALSVEELAALDKASALPPEHGVAMVSGTRNDRLRYAKH